MNQALLHNHWNELIHTCRQTDWSKKDKYAVYMAQIYHFVKYSTRILTFAASRMPLKDEVTHQRFLAHIKEENHHELLALNDVKNLGFRIEDLPEFAETKAFYLSQLALIHLKGPLAFTGYALLLEGMAVHYAGELAEKAAQLYGKNTVSFLKVHANEDEDHLPEALKLFESASTSDREVIIESFMLSKDLKAAWVTKCASFSFGKVEKTAA